MFKETITANHALEDLAIAAKLTEEDITLYATSNVYLHPMTEELLQLYDSIFIEGCMLL